MDSRQALACLQLGRYPQGGKISSPLQWPDQVCLPVLKRLSQQCFNGSATLSFLEWFTWAGLLPAATTALYSELAMHGITLMTMRKLSARPSKLSKSWAFMSSLLRSDLFSVAESDELASFDFLATYAPQTQASSKHTLDPGADDSEPSKWHQSNQKDNPGKGHGVKKSSWSGGQDNWARGKEDQQWSDGWSSSEVKELRTALSGVTRLLLRREDSLNLIKSEVGFVWHFRTNVDAAVVGNIYLAQAGWRQLKETKPEALTLPMRNTLLGCVIKELRQRLGDIREGTDTHQGFIRSNWLKSDAGKWSWSCLRWEPGSKALTVDTSKETLSHDQIAATLDSIICHAKTSGTISRFHPLRPVTQDMKGDSVGFLLQLPLRGQATDAMLAGFTSLRTCSVTQLIAAQIKTDRSGLPSQTL